MQALLQSVAMRTTATLDDELVARAIELTGTAEESALLRQGLEALVRVESARRPASLGGTHSRQDGAPGPARAPAAFPVITHDELLALVDRRRLWGQSLSAIHAHLVGAVLLPPAARLGIRDRYLRRVAGESPSRSSPSRGGSEMRHPGRGRPRTRPARWTECWWNRWSGPPASRPAAVHRPGRVRPHHVEAPRPEACEAVEHGR